MKKTTRIIWTAAILFVGIFASCKKKTTDETTTISTPPLQIGQTISSTTLGTQGSATPTAIKGTMKANTTYNVVGDIVINPLDTLYLQSGVTVCVQNTSTIIVRGVLISMGTQAAPNSFTACGVNKVNTIAQGESPTTDPAWNGGAGWWCGIECDTSCTLLCVKWTHIEFAGAVFPRTLPFVGGTQAGTAYSILFQTPQGDFIMEDSWIYGSIDDAVRIQCDRVSLMRNTFEKCSYTTGDVLNAKSGTVGDMAYNLFLGSATNGTKASNKGPQPVECNINMYNNTYINGGYRQVGQAGRSGAVNYEQGAEGKAYNNLLVNCRIGPRIVNNPLADTANCFMGNNYNYCDSVAQADQIFPVGYITKANANIVPTAAACGYVFNAAGAAAYDASSVVGKNNPMFVNFPLPEVGISHLYDISYVGSFNFKLQAGSPALGKGYTGFSALNVTKAKSPFAAIITQPGKDIGCYQSDGSGNQH